MKRSINEVFRLLTVVIMFTSVFAGCVTALALMILVVRLPLLLAAVLLACWVFSRLQRSSR